MFKNLRDNPILIHQMRHARWPSPRMAVLFAAGLTVIGLALTITIYAISPDCTDHRVLCNFSHLLILRIDGLLRDYGPWLTAVVAVIATTQAADSQAHQMMRLSQLSGHDIVGGYIAGVVFRLRGLWMISAGLVLPKLVNLTHYGISSSVSACFLVFDPSSCVPPKPSDIFLQQAIDALITTLCLATLFIGRHWLATTLGVWMALRLRRTSLALVGTFVLLGLLTMIQSWFFREFSLPGWWDWQGAIAASIFAVITTALGWAAYRQAVKCLRKAGPMIQSLKGNPILIHQMRRARWPSLQTAVLIAAALTMVGLTLTITAFTISPGGKAGRTLSGLILLAEMLLLVFGPLIAAIAAVVETTRSITSENHQMDHRDRLSDGDIIRGYLAGVTFRLRSLWMAAGGLLLPSIVALMHTNVRTNCNVIMTEANYNCTLPITQEFVIEEARTAATFMLSCAVLFIAWSWLATTLGVWIAFRYRRKGVGVVVTLLVVLSMIALTVTAVFGTSYWGTVKSRLILSGGTAIVLGWTAYRQAVKRARSMRG